MGHVDHYESFYASHNHMPGSDRAMKVTGTVVFTTSGCAAELREHPENDGFNPQVLTLDLVITPPGEGAVTTPALDPVDVEWRVPDAQIEYERVQFKVVGTDDAPPDDLGVDHPQ